MTFKYDISFAITTHNEGFQIQELIDLLLGAKLNYKYEIVVLDDYSKDVYTQRILNFYEEYKFIKLYKKHLDGDFANHKNYLISKCTGEYIFQLDADEMPHVKLLNNLKDIKNNHFLDLFIFQG